MVFILLVESYVYFRWIDFAAAETSDEADAIADDYCGQDDRNFHLDMVILIGCFIMTLIAAPFAVQLNSANMILYAIAIAWILFWHMPVYWKWNAALLRLDAA